METTPPKPITLMNVICPDAQELIKNKIIQNMNVIDWGKQWLDVMKLSKRIFLKV